MTDCSITTPALFIKGFMNVSRRGLCGNRIVVNVPRVPRCSFIGKNTCDMTEDFLKREKKKDLLDLTPLIWAPLSRPTITNNNRESVFSTLPCCCVRGVIFWAASLPWVEQGPTCCCWLSSHFPPSELAISQHSAYWFPPTRTLHLLPHLPGCCPGQTLQLVIYIHVHF